MKDTKAQLRITLPAAEASKAIISGLESLGYRFPDHVEVWHVYAGYDSGDIVEFELKLPTNGKD